jgi:hypothetical protein
LQGLAVCGKFQAASQTIKQRNAQLPLQLLNLLGQGWLGYSQLVCGAYKAACTGHGQKISQLLKLHFSPALGSACFKRILACSNPGDKKS